jgi:hypothetical protein
VVVGLIADAFAPVNDGIGVPEIVAGTRVANLVLPVVNVGDPEAKAEILVDDSDDPIFFEITPYSVWSLDYRTGTNLANGAGTYAFGALNLQTQAGTIINQNQHIMGATIPDGHNISLWMADSYVYTNNTANSVFLTLSFSYTGNTLTYEVYTTYTRIVGTKLYNIPQ